MKQPDIEIYLKDIEPIAIMNWLQSCLGQCTDWTIKGKVYHCYALEKSIKITLYLNAVGKWHCLYIASNETPWYKDLDCAKEANLYLKTEIRCSPDSWSEKQSETEEQANQWLKISDQQITTITWRTN